MENLDSEEGRDLDIFERIEGEGEPMKKLSHDIQAEAMRKGLPHVCLSRETEKSRRLDLLVPNPPAVD